MNFKQISLSLLLLTSTALAGEWFPEQTSAKEYRIIPCAKAEEFICGAALQGLVAKAVNNETLDELLVVAPRGANEKEWVQRTEKRTGIRLRGTLQLLEAVERYKPLIKGYILYRADPSEGDSYQLRKDMDCSANTATVLAACRG